MIAIDTSTWIAFLSGETGSDVAVVENSLADRQACLPPVVLSELLGDPTLPSRVATSLLQLPLLAIRDGYWQRAGVLRARVIATKRRAPLADTLIAQSCIDHDVRLVTRDTDFGTFQKLGGLKLAV